MKMITEEELKQITVWIKENIWRNPDVMFMQSDNQGIEDLDPDDLVDVISSLHNLLYEAVTGNRYDYAFHWANKIGAWTEDNIFDFVKGEEKK